MRGGGRRPSGRTVAARTLVVVVLLAVGACVPPRPSVAPAPTAVPTLAPPAAVPPGWTEHELDGGVHVAIPFDWVVLDKDDLIDDVRLAPIIRDYAGADALFGQLAAQGRSARVVLLGIDPRARGTGRFPPIISVVAVEPALPRLLLGIGADFATSALQGAFVVGPDVDRSGMETPLGEGIRLEFEHRVVTEPPGPGMLIEHDGVLVTTGAVSYLVSRSVETAGPFTDAPTLEAVVDTLRVEP